MFCSMVLKSRRISHNNYGNDTLATKQVSQKVLIARTKVRRNFLQQEIAYRTAREILKFPTIRCTVKNKGILAC